MQFDKMIPVVFALLLLIVGLRLSLGAAFWRKLRATHQDAWQALGSPSLIGKSTSARIRTPAFVWKAKYRELNDPALNRLGNIVRFFGAASVVLLIATLALLIPTLRH